MRIKSFIRKLIEKTGYTINKKTDSYEIDYYDQDGLRSYHNNDFMMEPSFVKAYNRGCEADSDHKIHWRVHIALWAALTASKLNGDFVECGVNRGFLSSAIMEYLDWDSKNRTFYLLDTFEGIDLRYVYNEEYDHTTNMNEVMIKSGYYVQDVESVKKNFSQWSNIRIIKGSVPETLNQVDSHRVAYLHLDMNCSPPELAAIEFFWERLLPGAVILLDDYGWRGHEVQKRTMDAFANEKNLMIATLPTGQGLLLKPPEYISNQD